MGDLLAGTTVKALDTPATKAAVATVTYATNSTVFTTGSIVSGTYEECAVVIVAPTTGRIKITTGARMINASSSGTILAPETRTGGTIGSGTAVESVGDGHGCLAYGTSFVRASAVHFVEGLTPGASYNVRLLHRTSNALNNATFALRELIVEPCT